MKRIDIRAILADPVLRRELMVRTIYAVCAREDETMTRERAERAYDAVQQQR